MFVNEYFFVIVFADQMNTTLQTPAPPMLDFSGVLNLEMELDWNNSVSNIHIFPVMTFI